MEYIAFFNQLNGRGNLGAYEDYLGADSKVAKKHGVYVRASYKYAWTGETFTEKPKFDVYVRIDVPYGFEDTCLGSFDYLANAIDFLDSIAKAVEKKVPDEPQKPADHAIVSREVLKDLRSKVRELQSLAQQTASKANDLDLWLKLKGELVTPLEKEERKQATLQLFDDLWAETEDANNE